MIERLDKIFSVFATLVRDGFSWQELAMYGLTLTAIVLIAWLSLEVVKKLLDIIYQIITIVKVPIEAIERVLTGLFSSISKLKPTHQPPTDEGEH